MALSSKEKLKRHAIGRLIMEGPIALFPPHKFDERGWLEPFLTIHQSAGDLSFWQSMTLFCDSTMNRDRQFLTPMLRYAVWEREKDLAGDSPWPHVKITLGMVSDWNAAKRIGRKIQRALKSPPIIAYGHSKTRRVPNVNLATDAMHYSVSTNNGLQYLEFSSYELYNDELAPILREYMTKLKDLMKRTKPLGWRERYKYDWSGLAPQQLWDWTVGNGFSGKWEPIDP